MADDLYHPLRHGRAVTRSLASAVPGLSDEQRNKLDRTLAYPLASIGANLYELPEHRTPGIVDNVLSLGALAGKYSPQWALDAQKRAEKLRAQVRQEMDLPEPHGAIENTSSALGDMLMQFPIAAETKAPAVTKGAWDLLKKVPGSINEWFSPTIRPTMGNYLSGAIAGGAINTAGEDKDVENHAAGGLARLKNKYAGGGKVSSIMKIVSDAIEHLKNNDVASARATLQSSPEALNHPQVKEALRHLGSESTAAKAAKTLQNAPDAGRDMKLSTFADGGDVDADDVAPMQAGPGGDEQRPQVTLESLNAKMDMILQMLQGGQQGQV